MAASRRYQPSKIFTIEEANAMLPLVRAITTDMVRLAQELLGRQQRLQVLLAGREVKAGDPYSDELAQIEEQFEKDARQLHAYAKELIDLGVEPKSATDGLVDFPSYVDGHLVYLCWKLDEPEVLHWHELDAGYTGRQPLTVESCAPSDSHFES